MPDISNSSWDEVDGNNTATPPSGWPEGQLPSTVNDCARMMMGAIKRFFNWQSTKLTAGTTTNYTLTYSVAPGALVDGMVHLVRFHAANAASPTLNVNGLGAVPLHSYQAGAWAAVSAAGVINANTISRVAYDSGSGAYRLLDVGESTTYVQTSTFGAGTLSFADFTNIPAGVNHLTIQWSTTGIIGGGSEEIILQVYGSTGVLDTGINDYWWLASAVDSAGALSGGAALNADSILLATLAIHQDVYPNGVIHIQDIQAIANTSVVYHSHYQTTTPTVRFISLSGAGGFKGSNRITGVRIQLRASGGGSPAATTGRVTLVGRS